MTTALLLTPQDVLEIPLANTGSFARIVDSAEIPAELQPTRPDLT